MIYTDSQLKEKIVRMIESFENEVVEFKEARTNYSFNDIGKYFSALSNEANLRGLQEAWLIFGISDDKRYVGTEFRKQGSLQSLKKEIVNGTNERLTFLEIYELTMEKCRVIAFQIPPAIRGIPTTWQGAAYAREHESISPLPMNKVDLLRSQIGMDWSKEIVEDATIEDLDEEAIKRARELFSKRQSDRKKAQEVLKKLSDIEVLNKAGITIKGKITRTALLLLGKSEAKYFFDGFIPRITWTLYNADNSVKAYEHFDIPMLMAVDKVYSRIRNVKYRYIAGQQTLFPDEVDQYEPELIKEIINNCIAHQDYRLRGKINVEEFEDRLVFINEGAFIPETIEQALEPGYKPPYYRNVFLCNAMVNLYMIDTNSMGIPMMYQIQRDKCFPLPTYDLNTNIFEESINDPEKKAQIFLNRFDFEIGKYKVYFVFYEKLKPYQKLLNERLHISFEDDGCFKQIKRKQKSFIGVMETKAYDNYSAMKRAYSALEIFLRYLEVFLNDNISVIGKNGLVIRQDTQEGIILPVKAFGYKSIKPEPRENFKTEIDTIVLGCQEKGKETYSQLNKIVDLHNAALNQQDLNDAFLNLWSALEVASVTDSSKSKIESVTDNIVSILQNDYFECIFSNILDDLKNNLGNRKVSLLLKDITEFDKEICKIAGFIFLEKYEKYREDYFANELKYYPNIRYKIYNLYEQRENREKLWHLSEKYCQRIEWHLYRLYRLRNAIVHAGESHKRIQMLGEHLHIYVDRVILELMVKLAKDKCLGTIQDVFTDTYLLLNKKKKNLKEPGNVDEQSIMLLLENFFIEE